MILTSPPEGGKRMDRVHQPESPSGSRVRPPDQVGVQGQALPPSLAGLSRAQLQRTIGNRAVQRLVRSDSLRALSAASSGLGNRDLQRILSRPASREQTAVQGTADGFDNPTGSEWQQTQATPAVVQRTIYQYNA